MPDLGVGLHGGRRYRIGVREICVNRLAYWGRRNIRGREKGTGKYCQVSFTMILWRLSFNAHIVALFTPVTSYSRCTTVCRQSYLKIAPWKSHTRVSTPP
jgi:hypothetical protein